MKNHWLDRRPKIEQVMGPEFHGKWFICKKTSKQRFMGFGVNHDTIYLHKDGKWRSTTYNIDASEYTGYFDSKTEAERVLRNSYRNN